MTYATWEEEAFEDAFPEVGETYYLRPRGDEPKVVVKQNRSGGTYSTLQCTFWCYVGYDGEKAMTQETPFIVLKRDFYPSVLHDFIGKWDDQILFKTKCESVGRAKRLKIKSMTKPFKPKYNGQSPGYDTDYYKRMGEPEPAPSGPSKPAAAQPSDALNGGSERGQPGAGGAPETRAADTQTVGTDQPTGETTLSQVTPPPAAPCPHENVRIQSLGQDNDGFYCKDCGERVG
jgi:hypothetical protein